jgi:hypothetical protein
MDLVLKKGPSHKSQEPLIIQYIVEGKKETRKVRVGEVVRFDDQLAYDILSRYPGFFEVVDGTKPTEKPQEDKCSKDYENKAMRSK